MVRGGRLQRSLVAGITRGDSRENKIKWWEYESTRMAFGIMEKGRRDTRLASRGNRRIFARHVRRELDRKRGGE